jgi:uncharacterized repeat protein (TIGR03803 family)
VLHDLGVVSTNSGVIADSKGNLYGTTFDGGGSVFGSVFRLSPGRIYTELYSFCP